jgi:hypothetical protein
MKKKIILVQLLVIISVIIYSQANITPYITENYKKPDYQKYKQAFSEIDTTLITTGFLSDKSFQIIPFSDYNGSDSAKTITQYKWQQLYDQVKVSKIRTSIKIPSLDSINNDYSKNSRTLKQFNTNNRIQNVIENIKNEEFIPISIIDIDYNEIQKNAFDQNKIAIKNDKLKETSLKSSESPFIIKKLYAACTLKSKVYNGQNVNFLFDKTFYFTNKNIKNCSFLADFDDGLGFREIVFGESLNISYSTIGRKKIKLRKVEKSKLKTTNQNEVTTASFLVSVEALTTPSATFEIPLNIAIPSSYPHGGVNIQGTGYVYTSDGSQNIKNPIIICEGFDPLNERGSIELYSLLNRQNFIENLKSKGYDFIILNFTHGATYIERNAYLLKGLIENINSRKVTQNKLVIIGASMGGLVSRYALAYMEKNGINHDTRLFVSFDSPQNGANIPLGAQKWLKFFGDVNGAVKDKYNNLICSEAAQQMLVYHSEYSPDPTNNPYRIEFLQNLNAMGYPTQLRKIAIANGSGNAYGQNKNDGTAFNPTDQIISWCYRNFWKVDIDGNSWAVPNMTPNTTIFYGNIEMTLFAHVYNWDFTDGSLTVTMENSYPYDNAPGGTSNSNQVIADGETDGYGDIETNVNNHCFIPTISSLAINTTNLFYNISADPNILSKTPFNAIYYPINSNEDHVNISEDCVNWMLDELVPQNVVLDGTGVGVWKGDVRAGNIITMSPGFSTAPGAVFHAYISPLQTSNILSASKTQNRKPNNYNNNKINDFSNTINEKNITEILSLYPNPSLGKFSIRNKDSDKISLIEVRNMQGSLISRISNVFMNEIYMDISNQPNGIYFVNILLNGRLQTTKIIKN